MVSASKKKSDPFEVAGKDVSDEDLRLIEYYSELICAELRNMLAGRQDASPETTSGEQVSSSARLLREALADTYKFVPIELGRAVDVAGIIDDLIQSRDADIATNVKKRMSDAFMNTGKHLRLAMQSWEESIVWPKRSRDQEKSRKRKRT